MAKYGDWKDLKKGWKVTTVPKKKQANTLKHKLKAKGYKARIGKRKHGWAVRTHK